jgi:hypothetical protein
MKEVAIMTSDLGFIDPTASKHRTKIAPAPRSMDLSNKVVGLLDNSKEQGDIILETVGTALRERYGVAKVIMHRKEFFSKPASGELIDAMAKEVQIAIAAVGG